MKKFSTIYNMIFGSHLYGTALPTSDTDYKEIILPDLEDLLLGGSITNSFTSTGNHHSKNSSVDVDCEFIPLHNMLDGFISGQSFAIEMVYGALSPNVKNKHFTDSRFLEVCQHLADNFLTSNISALMGYISSQSIKYGVKGRRLKEIENVLAIFEVQKLNYERLNEIPRDVLENDTIKKEYVHYGMYLGVSKTENDPCLIILDKIYPLTIKIDEAIERITKQIRSYGHRAITSANVGGADFKALSHAVRIAYQIIELLETHKLEFPLKSSQVVMDIKAMQYSLDYVIQLLETLINRIDELQTQKTLPSKEEIFEDFLQYKKDTLLSFYEPQMEKLLNRFTLTVSTGPIPALVYCSK